VPFLANGTYLLKFAAVDQAGNQEPTQTRWIFVSTLLGVGCLTSPVQSADLPPSGTVTVSGSMQFGTRQVPFSFTFTYPHHS
jgi:hypothetical protein